MKNSVNGHIAHDTQKGFRIHLLVFVLTLPVLWIVWFFTSRTYPWAAWQTAAWAVGLLFHYLGVYVFKNKKNN